MKKNKIFLSCEEAFAICDKAQYKEASFWERVRLFFRFSYCRMTRRYVSRNTKLTETLKNAKVNCLKTEERQALKAEFQRQLKPNKN